MRVIFSIFFVIIAGSLFLTRVQGVDLFKRPGKVRVYSLNNKQHIFMDKVIKTDDEWKEILSPEVYSITRKKGTELPFTGKYWNNHEEGIYYCACCDIALFSSAAKFDRDVGWPLFFEAVASSNVLLKKDRSFTPLRIEVICNRCEAHLGYVFDDGPPPTNKRFCINSAALNFKKKGQ